VTNLLGMLKLCEEITPRDLTQRSRKHLPGQEIFAGANKLPQKSCPLVQRGEGGWVQIVVAGDSAHDVYAVRRHGHRFSGGEKEEGGKGGFPT